MDNSFDFFPFCFQSYRDSYPTLRVLLKIYVKTLPISSDDTEPLCLVLVAKYSITLTKHFKIISITPIISHVTRIMKS